jgi:hypothetical protein
MFFWPLLGILAGLGIVVVTLAGFRLSDWRFYRALKPAAEEREPRQGYDPDDFFEHVIVPATWRENEHETQVLVEFLAPDNGPLAPPFLTADGRQQFSLDFYVLGVAGADEKFDLYLLDSLDNEYPWLLDVDQLEVKGYCFEGAAVKAIRDLGIAVGALLPHPASLGHRSRRSPLSA